MKVGIVLRVLWPAGAPRIAIEEAKGLSRRSHEVTLLIYRESAYEYRYTDLLKGTRVKFFTRGINAQISQFIHLFTLLYAYRIRGRESTVDFATIISAPSLSFSKKNYDVLLCHDEFAGISGYLAKKIKKIPYVVCLHEAPSKSPPFSPFSLASWVSLLLYAIRRTVLKNADIVIAVTDMIGASYESIFGVHVKTITPGCHPMKEFRFEKDNYIITVSRWDYYRNPFFFLDLAKEIEDGAFIIAGSWNPPSFENKFKDEIKNRGLSARVKVLSNLSESFLHDLYAKARAFVRWGETESGIATATLEAISYGCPVILNKALGVSKLIQHGVQGFVTEGVNAKEYAGYIQQLHKNHSKLEKMAREAWELSKGLSWESHVENLEAVLRGVVKEN